MKRPPVRVLVTLRRDTDGAQANWALADRHIQAIRDVSPGVEMEWQPCYTAAEIPAALQHAEVLYGIYGSFPLEAAPQLRWLHLNTSSLDRLRGQPVLHSGITITNNRGALEINVAEHALALLLALARRLPQLLEWQRRRHWPDADELRRIAAGWKRPGGEIYLPETHYLQPLELFGKTVGMVGYGAVGRRLAVLLRAFDCRILALKRNPDMRRSPIEAFAAIDAEGEIPQRWFGPAQIREMFPACDFVVFCQPSTPETRGQIGAEELRTLPTHACVVNVGRGDVIAPDALLRALNEKWIAGAALDVFAPEPLEPDSPWYSVPNVIVTPHLAGASDGTQDRNAQIFCRNLSRYLLDQPLANVVRKELLY